jgi:hypothetical protein
LKTSSKHIYPTRHTLMSTNWCACCSWARGLSYKLLPLVGTSAKHQDITVTRFKKKKHTNPTPYTGQGLSATPTPYTCRGPASFGGPKAAAPLARPQGRASRCTGLSHPRRKFRILLLLRASCTPVHFSTSSIICRLEWCNHPCSTLMLILNMFVVKKNEAHHWCGHYGECSFESVK